MIRKFGLIGYPLSHSFSKKYFTEKFQRENISGCLYDLYEIDSIEKLPVILSQHPELVGLNVTLPYKKQVIPFLNKLDASAEKAGAVNVIKIEGKNLTGYNSDYYGFLTTLKKLLNGSKPDALVLGSGGAASAVKACLKDLGIAYITVSRNADENSVSYENLKEPIFFNSYKLIINTSPVGMYPKESEAPEIPYQKLDSSFFLYDLVYNPLETEFMKRGKEKGASVMGGLEMLHLQAEKAWEIWNH